MNSKPVVAFDGVQDDVQSAYDYFESQLPGAGERFLGRYFAVADLIAQNAQTFPVKFDDYHRALIPRSNYAVYYFQEATRSVVVAVVNARRHPRLIRDFVRARRDSV